MRVLRMFPGAVPVYPNHAPHGGWPGGAWRTGNWHTLIDAGQADNPGHDSLPTKYLFPGI